MTRPDDDDPAWPQESTRFVDVAFPAAPDTQAPLSSDRARRRPHGRRAWLVGVVALALVAVGATALPVGPRIGVVRQSLDGAGATTPLTPGAGLPAEVVDPEARQAAVARILLDRGEAVRRGDLATWTRQQIPAATSPDFAALAALPLTRWTYVIDSATSGEDPTFLNLGVTVAYRLDVDQQDAVFRERMTLQHVDGGWRVAVERTEGARAQPWDLGTVSVVRGKRSVVIGIDTATSTLTRYATLADSVAVDVTAVWGESWTRRPVVVVAKTSAQVARALGRTPASLSRIAAVTTAEDGERGAATQDRGADRVWTNTPVMATLSALGREIVLRHEILHAATGAAATNATPLWLEEGLAEYVGYSGSGVALTVAVSDVLKAVRQGKAPAALPTPADFAGGRLAEAYESAHVACDLLVDEVGVTGLVRIYRLTAAGTGSADDNVEAAMTEVTGSGVAALESRWQSRLRDLAG